MSAENTKHTIIIEGVDKITHVYKNVGDMADKTTQKNKGISYTYIMKQLKLQIMNHIK